MINSFISLFKFLDHRLLWLTLCLCTVLATALFSSQVQAQAGSSSPLVYETEGSNIQIASAHGNAYSSSVLSTEQYPAAMLPEGVLRLSPNERYIVWIELNTGRLKLLEQQPDGGLLVRKDLPISIGKNGFGKEREGDKRTPVGVYHFTNFLADTMLIDFYGLGAYPLNYPNALDRRLSKTGSGIWLHGLPKGVEQRPKLDSDGCVIIDNISLQEMSEFIDIGLTHIVLTENDIHWQSAERMDVEKSALEAAFADWKDAWEARDNDQYLSFYAQDFDSFSRNKNEWDTYKRRVNNGKSSINVDVSQLSFFTSSKAEDIVSVRYYQRYQSSNYNWSGWKEQLWQEQDNQWQIIYEGNG
jgi:murein L,D-transpeptidase YafK